MTDDIRLNGTKTNENGKVARHFGIRLARDPYQFYDVGFLFYSLGNMLV